MLPILEKIKPGFSKGLLILVAVFLFFLILIVSSFYYFESKFKNKIYPNTYIGSINLSGLTKDGALSLINSYINKIDQNGVSFSYEGKETAIMPVIYSFDSDLAYRIIFFDAGKTVDSTLGGENDENFFLNAKRKITSLITKKQIDFITEINEEEIINILKNHYQQFETPAQDAKLVSAREENNNFVFSINQEKIGKTINYSEATKKLKLNLAKLNYASIELNSTTDYPKIYKNSCLNNETNAKKIISQSPLFITYENNEWEIIKETLVDWLELKINENQKIIVGFNLNKVGEYIKKNISLKIDNEPINARFNIKDGRVAEFINSQDGKKTELETSALKIEDEFINNNKNRVELIVNITKSEIKTEDINNFGIKEIVGTGQSNFVGSPVNRRHNIKTGASAINGLLIEPEQEFSLVKALGEINAASGYLPELVIRGNETIPEYGGGLCQIGTTLFRAALASGLPITARQNHSYRVSYYEPAGVDAAVYDPWPDVRFINDTNNYILIQIRIIEDDLYFDFWGTKDGRSIEQTKPVVYNIVRPEPKKVIETLDLPIGQEKCTERAHNGADAYFDYAVIYPGGEKKEKRFSSHYIPWREVCLIGVEKLTETENKKND